MEAAATTDKPAIQEETMIADAAQPADLPRPVLIYDNK